MPYSYENYDEKASTYTNLRQAIGCQAMISFYAGNPTSDGLKNQILLDAGCGTGNYMAITAYSGFKSVFCSDFNQEMLNEAKKQWKHIRLNKNGVKVVDDVMFSKDSITDLSRFKDGTFHALMNNQVVHHLRPDDDFSDLRQAAKEFYRLLKTEGRLTINWSPAYNQQNAFYWGELIPEAIGKLKLRMPSQATMKEILIDSGFRSESIKFESLKNEILCNQDTYSNVRNFIDIDKFSRCDSSFNLATKQELENATNKIRKMDKDGTLDAWFENKEVERKRIGQTVTVFAIKK